jgi:hypothetical protein
MVWAYPHDFAGCSRRINPGPSCVTPRDAPAPKPVPDSRDRSIQSEADFPERGSVAGELLECRPIRCSARRVLGHEHMFAHRPDGIRSAQSACAERGPRTPTSRPRQPARWPSAGCRLGTKRLTNPRAFSATSRQPLSIVCVCLRRVTAMPRGQSQNVNETRTLRLRSVPIDRSRPSRGEPYNLMASLLALRPRLENE